MARRGDLNTELVIDAALARVDAHGIDSLSMRELATDLEVSPMALYRHVRNKDELLDLLADRVISRFMPTPGEGGWPEQAARICRRLRAELIAHPDLATRVLQRPVPSSAVGLRVNGTIVSMLVESGLPRAAVPKVYWVLSTYTMGSALFEIERNRAVGSRKRRDSAARRRNVAALVEALDVDVPDTDALATVLSVDFGDEQFEFGLNAVIRGLEASIKKR